MTVSGQGTTFNLPNYHGELFTVTPTETPFLSAIGGLNGAKTTTATEFEWQTVDRRASTANNTALEGAAAPAGTERARSNVSNIVEIHHSAIEVSYTKMAATGKFNGINVAPQSDDFVAQELGLQTMAELESMAVDIEKSFLSGAYQKPTDNTTARKTRGVLTAITSNTGVPAAATVLAATIVASTGVFTTATSTLAVGSAVDVNAIVTTTGITPGRYYVITKPSGTTFTISATKGGSAVTLTTDGSATVAIPGAVAKVDLDTLLTLAFNNGAKLPQGAAVIMAGPAQKVALSNAYSIPALNQTTLSRTIGGVAMDTLVTDFGTFGVAVNRWMPVGTIAVLDLSVCSPVFLSIPDKGLLFTEELSRVGASRKFQLYGEIGLEYGPENYHALLSNLA